MQDKDKTLVIGSTEQLAAPETRRGFLSALGVGGAVVLLPSVFAACKDSTGPNADPAITQAYIASQTQVLDLSTDVGIFRFASVLEQLEQAFYNQLFSNQQVLTSLFPNAVDQEALNDIRNDENTHRLFLDAALGSNRLPQLTFNFGSAFSSRAAFLAAARTFTNTGVSAYNGAGRFIRDVNNLLVSGKIVSVEGRHAATLQDLSDADAGGAGEATGRRFADLTAQGPSAAFGANFGTDPTNALDDALSFTQVAAIADPVVVQPLQLINIPT